MVEVRTRTLVTFAIICRLRTMGGYVFIGVYLSMRGIPLVLLLILSEVLSGDKRRQDRGYPKTGHGIVSYTGYKR